MTGSRITVICAAGVTLSAVLCASVAHAAGFAAINRIKASGELHAAVLEPPSPWAAEDRKLVDRLAARLGARAVIHRYVGHEALLAALASGDVDLVAEPVAADRPLAAGLSRSLPLRHADLWIVTSPFVAAAKAASPLAVQFASDAWHQALSLRAAGRQVSLRVVPARWSRADLLGQVAAGRLPASLAYDDELASLAGVRPRQKLKTHLALGWVLREPDRVLRRRVDDFLRERGLTRDLTFADAGDWPAVLARGRIRLVTLYRPETYFAWGGQLLGFEFELVKAFATAHGLALDVVIASDNEDLQARLARGEADIGAAFLRADALAKPLVASTPYYRSRGRVVSLRGRYQRLGPRDLHDRSVLVADSSPHLTVLDDWRRAGIGLKAVKLVGEPAERLVERVVAGSADFALIDDHAYQLLSLWRTDVDGLLAVDSVVPRVWALRRDNPDLLARVNRYWRQPAASARVRVAESKYFSGDRASSRVRAAVTAFGGGGFSPYDELVRRYAAYYGFDWRLILAMVFQESRFDPNAVSRSGARGLMQVQQVASRQVGIDDLFDPKAGIHAGIRYLDWVRAQFEPDLDVRDRTWFSLAAYNGGLTHVKAARELARRQGLDPRRWFGHVETALAVLAQPEHDPEGRYRSLDAPQVITYVSRIRDYFQMYVRLTESPNPPAASSAALADHSGTAKAARGKASSMAALGLK